jgi:hypothetical protein
MFADCSSPSLAMREGAELVLCAQSWRVGRMQADGRLLLSSEAVSSDRNEAWQRAREDQAHELLKRSEEEAALTGDITKFIDKTQEVSLGSLLEHTPHVCECSACQSLSAPCAMWWGRARTSKTTPRATFCC